MSTQLVVNTSQQGAMEIHSARLRAMILTLLALRGQIEASPQGRLVLSWNKDAPDVKWEIAAFGHGAPAEAATTN